MPVAPVTNIRYDPRLLLSVSVFHLNSGKRLLLSFIKPSSDISHLSTSATNTNKYKKIQNLNYEKSFLFKMTLILYFIQG